MPEKGPQFDYPEGRWGLAQNNMMDKGEWEEWLAGPGGKQGSVFGADMPLTKQTTPGTGFLIQKDHPQIKDLKKDFDTLSVPHPGWQGRYFFMKPKQKTQAPLVSEVEDMGRSV